MEIILQLKQISITILRVAAIDFYFHLETYVGRGGDFIEKLP
jgi:hypothetical protein